MERIELSVEPRILNPVTEPNVTAILRVDAVDSAGSRRPLPVSDVLVSARTKAASGGGEVVSLDGDRVVPMEGGIAAIVATVKENGVKHSASTDVLVRPFYRDYHQTLVLKLFLGMEGVPTGRIAEQPLFRKRHDVVCTFEEALEVIRKTDNLTRGIPKIVYLVGWQKGGHDHLYPAWDKANPLMKRTEDPSALDSLRWLIREAKQYHTTVSLHVNMADAYRASPLWNEYVANDCIARDENGEIMSIGIAMKDRPIFNVVYPKEWAAGLAQRRIDRLIDMIPELRDGHTIHIDAFIAQREDGTPISPWHAKSENGGLTPEIYVETQRRIFHYWRERGFDVTGEGIFWAHPAGEGFTGLQGMSWWYPSNPTYQMEIPECLMARGRTDRNGDGDFRFASSMHGEDMYAVDKERLSGFLGMFCRTTLPWHYLSRLDRIAFENEVLRYSDGVVARREDKKAVIRRGDFVLREDNDLFVPALWNQPEIIAYSELGYVERYWLLPEDWSGITSVDVSRITPEGLETVRNGVEIKEHRLRLSLNPGESVSITPA